MEIKNTSQMQTASSILKNAPSVKNEAASIDTNDSFVRSKDQDFLKGSRSSGVSKGAFIAGTITGAAAGGVAGGFLAHDLSMDKVKANNKFNSVELEIQKPVMQEERLIYHTGSSINKFNVTNPVMRNGEMVMEETTKTFSGYGEPVIKDKTYKVKQTILVDRNQTGDIREHGQRINAGSDCYSKTIKLSYTNPTVKFETGVHTGLNTVLGCVGGAAVGSIAGALVAVTLSKLSNM